MLRRVVQGGRETGEGGFVLLVLFLVLFVIALGHLGVVEGLDVPREDELLLLVGLLGRSAGGRRGELAGDGESAGGWLVSCSAILRT